MKKPLVLIVLVAAIAVFAFFAFSSQNGSHQSPSLHQREATAAGDHSVDVPANGVASGTSPADQKHIAELEAALTKVNEENAKLDTLVRELRGEISILQAGRSRGPNAGRRETTLPFSRAVLNDMLSRPETVKQAMDWIKADLRPQYASLIALNPELTLEQREQVMDVLAERYATRMDLAAMGGGQGGPDLKTQLDNEYRSKLVGLVGEDSAALFEKAEVKPVSWERMQRLDNQLRYEAAPLTKTQYQALWPILSNAVFYFSMPTTAEEADNLIQKRVTLNQQALQNASPLLDSAQLGSLTRLLKDDEAAWRVQIRARLTPRSPLPSPPASKPTD